MTENKPNLASQRPGLPVVPGEARAGDPMSRIHGQVWRLAVLCLVTRIGDDTCEAIAASDATAIPAGRGRPDDDTMVYGVVGHEMRDILWIDAQEVPTALLGCGGLGKALPDTVRLRLPATYDVVGYDEDVQRSPNAPFGTICFGIGDVTIDLKGFAARFASAFETCLRLSKASLAVEAISVIHQEIVSTTALRSTLAVVETAHRGWATRIKDPYAFLVGAVCDDGPLPAKPAQALAVQKHGGLPAERLLELFLGLEVRDMAERHPSPWPMPMDREERDELGHDDGDALPAETLAALYFGSRPRSRVDGRDRT